MTLYLSIRKLNIGFSLILFFLHYSSIGQVKFEAQTTMFGYKNVNAVEYMARLFFSGSSEKLGRELVEWDGNQLKVHDIWMGKESSRPENLIVYRDKLFFNATTAPPKGKQLWYFDGNQLKELVLNGVGHTSPEYLVVYNDELYFYGWGNPSENGLYSWNDFEFRFHEIDILHNPIISNLFVYKDKLYIAAFGKKPTDRLGTSSRAFLLSWDGNSFTIEIENIPDSPEEFFVFEDLIFFSRYANEPSGLEYLDIRSKTYNSIMDMNISNCRNFILFQEKLFFTGGFDGKGCLFSWDGNKVELVQKSNDKYGFPVSDLAVYHNLLYFGSNGDNGSNELWSYDGDKLRMVKDIDPKRSLLPRNFVVYQDKLLFNGNKFSGQFGTYLTSFKN